MIFNSKKLFLFILPFFFFSCSKNDVVESISENQLFTIPYGNFEEHLSIYDLNNVGSVRNGITMRDGFFYITDGNSEKILETNSYGDLLTLFYNEDSKIADLLKKSNRKDISIHKELSYPFDFQGMIAVDSNKVIYTVCSIPRDRHEQNIDGSVLYSQTILRFSRDGSTVDYIGQQGPGGTPFPFIKNIYTTEKDELVVVCTTDDGLIVYWFGSNGYLKYMVPVTVKDAPTIEPIGESSEIYLTIENVIPDPSSYKLFVKIDYYSSYIDEESKLYSGVNYVQTYLYPLNILTETYGEGVSIPPYEESVVADYSKLVYKIPYDFLGVTKNGWKFFIIKNDTGFDVAIIQSENQRILRRHFNIDTKNTMYYTMDLSLDGIITAMYLEKDCARVVWYRTDNLIDAILKN